MDGRLDRVGILDRSQSPPRPPPTPPGPCTVAEVDVAKLERDAAAANRNTEGVEGRASRGRNGSGEKNGNLSGGVTVENAADVESSSFIFLGVLARARGWQALLACCKEGSPCPAFQGSLLLQPV